MSKEFVEFPKISRWSRECVVTEKIDGTNASIFISEDLSEFLCGSRTRWITPESDNAGFARWAYENKDELLKLGPGHHFGEWWGSGIQRGYGLLKGDKRFSLFNVGRWNEENKPSCVSVVPKIYEGSFDNLNVFGEMSKLKAAGSFASPGFRNPEGIVIYHTQARVMFKKTFEKDDAGKNYGA